MWPWIRWCHCELLRLLYNLMLLLSGAKEQRLCHMTRSVITAASHRRNRERREEREQLQVSGCTCMIDDGAMLQWSHLLREIDLPRVSSSLLFKWLHCRLGGGRSCSYMSASLRLRRVCSRILTDWRWAHEIFELLTLLLKKPEWKTRRDRSACQADVQALKQELGGVGGGEATDFTGPPPQKPFVILKCIFMNNSYFHFTTAAALDLIRISKYCLAG